MVYVQEDWCLLSWAPWFLLGQAGPYHGAEDQLQQSRGQSEQLPNLSQGSSFETCFLAR